LARKLLGDKYTTERIGYIARKGAELAAKFEAKEKTRHRAMDKTKETARPTQETNVRPTGAVLGMNWFWSSCMYGI